MAEAITSDPVIRKVADTEILQMNLTQDSKQIKKITIQITYFLM